MISVFVHGSRGRLGSSIVSLLEKQENFELIEEIEKETFPECNIVVDVTSAEGVKSILPKLTNQKLIIGATGDLPIKELKKYSERNAVYVVPNFSKGIRSLYQIINNLIDQLGSEWKFKIIETHHINKKDSPSGTAKNILNIFKNKGKDIDIESIREGDLIGEHIIEFNNGVEKIEITHESFSRDVYARGCLELINEIVREKRGLREF